MSDKYIGDIFNSDLDTFKQKGFETVSVTFAGVLGAGAQKNLNSEPISIDSLDFTQILFDNSYYHPGRFRNLSLENATMVLETTNGSELQCNVNQLVSGNTITMQAVMFNPYSVAVNLQPTTITFIYIPYQATI